jgi:phosphoadenosine phosphosulfate reductase
MSLLALGLDYKEKLEKSLLTIREYEAAALKADPDGYYVCDSYGKDSTVLVHLFKLAGVKFKAHHSLTTIDPPELIHFGRKYHADTIVHRPEVPLLKYMADSKSTPPTRLVRWCCEKYKEHGGTGKAKAIGVRAEESPRRAATWRTLTLHRKDDSLILSPILYWKTSDIWRHIRDFNLPYCSLYDEGFTRLGCVGCPMSSRRKDDFKRWPGFEKAWQSAFQKMWDRLHGTLREDGEMRWFDRPSSNINSWQDLWAWWMEEGNNPDEEDECQGILDGMS